MLGVFGLKCVWTAARSVRARGFAHAETAAYTSGVTLHRHGSSVTPAPTGFTTAVTALVAARSPSQKRPDSFPRRPAGRTALRVCSQAAVGISHRSMGGYGVIYAA